MVSGRQLSQVAVSARRGESGSPAKRMVAAQETPPGAGRRGSGKGSYGTRRFY